MAFKDIRGYSDMVFYRKKAFNENRDRWLNLLVQTTKAPLVAFENDTIHDFVEKQTVNSMEGTYALLGYLTFGLSAWLSKKAFEREVDVHADFEKRVLYMIESAFDKTHANYCVPSDEQIGELFALRSTALLATGLSFARDTLYKQLSAETKTNILKLVQKQELLKIDDEMSKLYRAVTANSCSVIENRANTPASDKRLLLQITDEVMDSEPLLLPLLAVHGDFFTPALKENALKMAKAVDINGAIIIPNVRLSSMTPLALCAYLGKKVEDVPLQLMQKILFAVMRQSLQVGAVVDGVLSENSFASGMGTKSSHSFASRYADLGVFVVMGLPEKSKFWQNTGKLPEWVTPKVDNLR